jgi:hypothetical protein
LQVAVKRYINDEWVTISGLQGPEGNAGPTGDPGIVSQTTAPTNTSVLWLDTDEPAAEDNRFPQPKFISGKYYTTDAGVTAGSASTLNRVTTLPFWVHATTTFDRIGIRVTATAASSTIRLGIYSSNANYEPTTLVLDAGTVDSATAISNQEITINQELTPGMYFLAATAQGGTPSWQVVGNNPLSIPGFSSIPFNSIAGNQGILTNYFVGSVSGALPNPFGSTSSTTNGPRVFLRAV